MISKKSRKMCFSMAFPDNLVCYSDTRPRGVRCIGFSNTGKCIPTFNLLVRSCCLSSWKCKFSSWCRPKSGETDDLGKKTNCIKENFPTQTRGHGLAAPGKICSTSKWVIEFHIQEILDKLSFITYTILRKKEYKCEHCSLPNGQLSSSPNLLRLIFIYI